MRKEKEKRRTMRDRIREKANKPRVSKYDYIIIPDGFEKFVIEGKTKTVGDKKTITKRMDIMPYIAGKGNPNCDAGDMYFERTFFVHKVDLGDNNNITFVCPNKSAGLPCPACEYANKLRKDPHSTKEEIANWTAKERQLFNVIDLADPEKIKIYDVSYHMFGKLLEARISGQDDDEDFDTFAELEGGKTLRVQFEEKKFGAGRYHEAISIDFKPREEDYEDAKVEETACLDELLIIRPYDELQKMLFEDSTVVEDDDDDDKVPMSEKADKNSKKAEKKSGKKPVIEDEDDEEDFEDEEEEEEKPAKKSSKKETKKSSKTKCPFGHKFGVDCDEAHCVQDCKDCDIWDECSDEQERLED